MDYFPGPLFFMVAHWVVSATALFVTAYLVPGIRVKNFLSALIASAVIGFAHATIGKVLLFLTLPITLLTLGLFTFVIDGIVLKLCAAILRDFDVRSWLSAILGAFLLAVISSALHWLII